MRSKLNPIFLIGIILLYISVFYFMDMLGINFKNFILLSAGIILLILSYKFNITFIKYVALLILTEGLLLTALPLFNITSINIVDYYLIFLCVYFTGCLIVLKKIVLFKVFLVVVSIVLIRCIMYTSLNVNIKYAYYFYIITVMLSVYFITIREKVPYSFLTFPLCLYVFGTNNLLHGNNIINNITYKFINLGLLLLSALIILLISRNKTSQEDKNERKN